MVTLRKAYYYLAEVPIIGVGSKKFTDERVLTFGNLKFSDTSFNQNVFFDLNSRKANSVCLCGSMRSTRRERKTALRLISPRRFMWIRGRKLEKSHQVNLIYLRKFRLTNLSSRSRSRLKTRGR